MKGRVRHPVLLQVRDHPGALEQEARCFAEASGIPRERWRTHNLVDEPRLDNGLLAAGDLVVLGGAGAHSVTERHDFTAGLEDALAAALDRGVPFFGSCFGHHFLAAMLGGRVERDPESEEVGTFAVELTASGRADPLFAGLPARFAAQLGHHDRVVDPGPELVELAYSERCRHQALRIEGKPVYGTQFHPELDELHMRERLEIYRDRYLGSEEEFRRFVAGLGPTPESSTLLRRFIALYC